MRPSIAPVRPIAGRLRLAGLVCLLAACVGTPKGEPPDLLAEGKRLFEAGELKAAARHFRAIESKHPESEQAQEALYSYAEAQRRLHNPQNAFNAYKKFVTRYPNSPLSVAVAESEFRLGKDLLDGKVPGTLFFGTDRSFGVRVLEHMQIHFQNHSRADEALMRLADYHIEEEEYEEAAEVLRRLLSQYPRSKFTLRARFQLALALWRQNEGPDYDERTLLLARRAFQDFVATTRLQGMEEALKEQIAGAERMIQKVNERLAHKHYRIGRFYERTRHPESAIYHYEYCIESFPGTEYATRSRKRLQELRGAG